ncbi:hypothetical protein HN958_00930 [Candidatus Falkowbacteria bacterium]|jgi:hypothetical protein|nr:hypothetical protein [Candidatus Falkowbacteria bacterium]
MKKLFTIGVVLTTILWTMGVAAFIPVASATALEPGDLIMKDDGSSSAVYFYAADGDRYMFSTANTYFSWYEGFDAIKKIDVDDLAAIDLAGNVVVRPGSNLIEFESVSGVYAVEPEGLIREVAADVAEDLYGADWADGVVLIQDGFYTDYTVGSALDADAYGEGTLVQEDSTVYYVNADGSWSAVEDEDAFDANGWNWDYVVTNTVTMPSAGAAITGTMYNDTSQGGGGGEVGDGALTVSLSSGTPATDDFPTNATNAAANLAFTDVTFAAGSDPVTITGLKVTRTGLSSDAAISYVKLFDDLTQLGTSQSLNSVHQASFNSLSIEVPANGTKTITLAADMTASATYNGNIIMLGIDSADDITTDASIGGNFPVVGNSMTLNTGVTIGSATLYNGPLGTRNGTDLTVDTDAEDIRFVQVKITAGSQEGLVIKQLTAIKNGTCADADLENIELYNDTTGATVATVASLSNGKAIYDLSASPIEVEKGKSVELSILADMAGTGAGRTATFDIHDGAAYTMLIDGASYGYGITPSRNNFCASAGTCTAQTINQGYLTLSLSSATPATGYVAPGASQAPLLTFDYTAAGEPLNVTNTAVKITVATATIGQVTNVTLYDGDDNVVAGPQDPATSGTAFNLTDAYTVPVGTTQYTLKADIASDTSSSDTVIASMAAGAVTAKGANSGKTTYTTSSGSTVPPASAVTGKTQTVKAAALTVNTAATPVAGNLVVNAQDAVFAYFDLDASTGGEDVKISSITVTDTLGAGSDYSGVRNLELWGDPDTTDGTTENIRLETTSATATNAATVAFTFKNPLIVSKSMASQLTLKADIVSTTGTSHTFNIANTAAHVVATGYDTGNAVTETTTGSGQAQTIQSVGTLLVQVSADRPSQAQFVAGTTGNHLMSYKFKTTYEEIDVTDFYIATTASANADVSRVKVYLDGELIGQENGYALDNGGDAHVVLDSGTFIVPVGPSYKTLSIKVDFASKANLTDADTLEIGFGDSDGDDSEWGATGGTGAGSYLMVATGVSSGTAIAASTIHDDGAGAGLVSASYVHYLYDGVLVASLSEDSPTGTTSPGTNMEVIRLDLAAIGDDITLEDLEVVKSGTCTVTGTTVAAWKSPDGQTTYESFTAGTAWLNETSVSVSVNGGDAFTKDIEIPAGTTKTISLFGDTNGCTAAETLGFTVSGSDITSGIEWENAEANDVDAVITKNLPITGGTLKY